MSKNKKMDKLALYKSLQGIKEGIERGADNMFTCGWNACGEHIERQDKESSEWREKGDDAKEKILKSVDVFIDTIVGLHEVIYETDPDEISPEK